MIKNKLGKRKVDSFNNFKRYVLSKDSNGKRKPAQPFSHAINICWFLFNYNLFLSLKIVGLIPNW